MNDLHTIITLIISWAIILYIRRRWISNRLAK